MQNKKLIKECASLWNNLSWYYWGGTFIRAILVCKKLDEYKKDHPFIYHLTSFIYPFMM